MAPREGELSAGALNAVLKRMGAPIVQHGFRSTFRDWCSECTNCSREVVEATLAHAIGDKVEAAYRRGDVLEKRRGLMSEWAAFLAEPQGNARVVPTQNKRA